MKPVVIDGVTVKVNFWDLSGHPEFFEVRNEFYKDVQGAVLVYDASSRKSFEGLDAWLQEAKSFGAKDPVIFVCGNKVRRGSPRRRDARGPPHPGARATHRSVTSHAPSRKGRDARGRRSVGLGSIPCHPEPRCPTARRPPPTLAPC